jgi:hypothetical protein
MRKTNQQSFPLHIADSGVASTSFYSQSLRLIITQTTKPGI